MFDFHLRNQYKKYLKYFTTKQDKRRKEINQFVIQFSGIQITYYLNLDVDASVADAGVLVPLINYSLYKLLKLFLWHIFCKSFCLFVKLMSCFFSYFFYYLHQGLKNKIFKEIPVEKVRNMKYKLNA